jgi:hypothetical protein
MIKNWSKGTQPLVLQQTGSTQDASTKEGLLSLVLKKGADNEESRDFLLRVVQPGLSGLMDGSVSTLAPIFATAFATHSPFTAFLVGLASATGAGISMAFSEALSDDGELTGRGNPVMRGGYYRGHDVPRRVITYPAIPDTRFAPGVGRGLYRGRYRTGLDLWNSPPLLWYKLVALYASSGR